MGFGVRGFGLTIRLVFQVHGSRIPGFSVSGLGVSVPVLGSGIRGTEKGPPFQDSGVRDKEGPAGNVSRSCGGVGG